MNVLDMRPETLADVVNPALVEEALRGLEVMTDVQRETLVFALSYWMVQTIERPTDLEGVLLLDRICAIAIRLSGETTAASKFCIKLETLRDLLETKRQGIVARLSRQRPRQADKVIAILQTDGPLGQTALAAKLSLSLARTNQLMAVMEERGFVNRVQREHECQVSLPSLST